MLDSMGARRVLRTPRRHAARWSLAVAGLLFLPGCYALVPADVETISPPARVRVLLTPQGAARAAQVLGTTRASLDGQLVGSTPEGLQLVVPAAVVQSGTRMESLVQELRIPRSELVVLHRKELDRTRTALLAAGGGAAVVYLLIEALSGERGGTTVPPPGGGGTELRIPLISFFLR